MSIYAPFGLKPVPYGRDVIKGLVKVHGIREPPIDEYTVADFLGYEIKIVTKEETEGRPGVWKILKTACAHLFKEENKILVRGDMNPQRTRLSIFHEFGHDLLPWHTGYNFACSQKAILPVAHQKIEKEAFLCGTQIMMPIEMLVPYILGLPTGISAISDIRGEFDVSMEAMAINYSFVHPGICGMALIEPAKHLKIKSIEDIATWQNSIQDFQDKQNYLRVKYFVKSRRFPHFIKPNTKFYEDSPIYGAYFNNIPLRGELPLTAFGLIEKQRYLCDSAILGETGKMVLLLWVPDHQGKLDYETGDIFTYR